MVEQIGHSTPLQTVLYRCRVCGALWEAMERWADQVTRAQAIPDFPTSFDSHEGVDEANE